MTTSILPAPAVAIRRARLTAAARIAAAAIASGILLGFSTPLSFRWTLAPLAWFWLAPLLLALGPKIPAWRFLASAYGACTVTGLISTWGVGLVVGPRLIAAYFAYAGLTLALPFIPFLATRRLVRWNAALWSAIPRRRYTRFRPPLAQTGFLSRHRSRPRALPAQDSVPLTAQLW